MEFFNTYEFWLGVSILIGFVILLWRVVAKRNNVPIPAEMMVSDTLQEIQKFAEEKAEYLKKKKELSNKMEKSNESEITDNTNSTTDKQL